MLSKTPMALMKTTKLVEPALINGKGKPVGGILPDMAFYCTNFYLSKNLSTLNTLHLTKISIAAHH